MKQDPLQQYAKLKQQLMDEKSRLEARLNEINQVLVSEPVTSEKPQAVVAGKPASSRGRGRGRGASSNTMSLREAGPKALSNGPVARKDLAKAVEGVGYKFSTKNPLNSIGSVLYAKNTPVKSKDGKFFVESGADLDGGWSNGSGMKADAPRGAKKKSRSSPEGRARWAKQKAGK